MKMQDIKDKYFKVYTSNKEEYAKVVEIARSGGYEAVQLNGYMPIENYGITFSCLNDILLFTDGSGSKAPLNFNAPGFISDNTTEIEEEICDICEIPTDVCECDKRIQWTEFKTGDLNNER